MNNKRKTQILTALKAIYAEFGKDNKPYSPFVYRDFYWHELTELAEISEHVTCDHPAAINPYLTGKHLINPSIIQWEPPTPESIKSWPPASLAVHWQVQCAPEFTKSSEVQAYLIQKGVSAQKVTKKRSTGHYIAEFFVEDMQVGVEPAGAWAKKIETILKAQVIRTKDVLATWREGQPVMLASVEFAV